MLKFSIITPTYNRAGLLARAFASLQAQTLRELEWIVVDDGSTDDTREVVAGFAATADFPVRYIGQTNAGKHVAVNAGVRAAQGFFAGIMDSDDRYERNALERCWWHWQQIPAERQQEYVGLTALTAYEDGSVVGERFPAEVCDADAISSRTAGDKKGFQRAEVLRQFPFPEDLGRFVPEGLWNRIALRCRTRYVNEVWSRVEYRRDGLSARSIAIRTGSPLASSLYHKELLRCGRRLGLRARVRTSANLVRFLLHAGRLRDCVGVPVLPLALAFGLGVALYARDRVSLAKAK